MQSAMFRRNVSSDPEDGGNAFKRNVDNSLKIDYTASQPRRSQSYTPRNLTVAFYPFKMRIKYVTTKYVTEVRSLGISYIC
jgi:hypothetical protein